MAASNPGVALPAVTVSAEAELTRRRLVLYAVVAAALGFVALVLPAASGVSDATVHAVLDTTAVFFAGTVALLAAVHHGATRSVASLRYAAAFTAVMAIDVFHGLAVSDATAALWMSPAERVGPWTWLLPQSYLGGFLLFAAYRHWNRAETDSRLAIVRATRLAFISAAVIGLALAVLLYLPLPPAYFPGAPLPRPLELIPGALFLAALTAHLRRGLWRNGEFDHWLVLSLLFAAAAHLFFMVFSRQPSDAAFDAAHVLNSGAYLCVLVGVLRNTYVLFRRARSQARDLAVIKAGLEAEMGRRLQAEAELVDLNSALGERIAERTAQLEAEVQAHEFAVSKLNDSRRMFELVADNIEQVLWLTSADGDRLLYVSRGYERLWGRTREALYTDRDSWVDTVYPEDRKRVTKSFARAMCEGEEYDIEFRIVRPDGTVRWVRDHVFVVRDAIGVIDGIAGLTVDITEARAAAEEHNRLQRTLLEATRQAGMAEVATGVLHNIGNVLTSVNVACEMAAQTLTGSRLPRLARTLEMLQGHGPQLGRFLAEDPKGAKVLPYLDELATRLASEQIQMRQELEAIGRHIDHIKSIVARQQSYAAHRGCLEDTDIADVVGHAFSMSLGPHHQIDVDLQYGELPLVRTDKHKLLQILVNLIKNAKQAVRDGAPGKKLITVSTACMSTGEVEIRVADTGCGIPADALERIFEYGYTTKDDGSGFGLHASANAARELGGTLSARSDGVDQGATFILTLPLATFIEGQEP
ncbi:MAG: PAS domain-containing protein [Gammaproteobacteria bacterium]|nr:PAS domain-containing protein [Gammaproteobacteria bacterium]